LPPEEEEEEEEEEAEEAKVAEKAAGRVRDWPAAETTWKAMLASRSE
jgi:hypothetical protein